MTSGGDVYLGVDGGNSGTRAILIDAAGQVLGRGLGGNANHQGQGFASAVHNIATAVHGACQHTEVAPRRLSGAYFALAGDDTDDDCATLTAGLAALWPGLRFDIGNDVWAGLRAGAMQGHGIAVNCGSGAGVVGRAPCGQSMIIPDLGYVYGDSGGGGQISTDAFRAVSRAADGRGLPTMLTRMLLDATGCPTVEALRLALYHERIPAATYQRATRLVLEASAAGDAVATAILRHIGEELGVSCAAVARRLGVQEDAFALVLTGGTFRTLRSVLAQATIERARQEAPHCMPALPLVLPVGGAALLALDAAGTPVTPEHYARLREQGFGWHPEEVFEMAEERIGV